MIIEKDSALDKLRSRFLPAYITQEDKKTYHRVDYGSISSADTDYLNLMEEQSEKDQSYDKEYYSDKDDKGTKLWQVNHTTYGSGDIYRYRNPHKELIMTMEGAGTLGDDEPDWRDWSNNGVCNVNHRIGLFVDDIKFNPKVDLEMSDAKDFLDIWRGGLEKAGKVKMTMDIISTLTASNDKNPFGEWIGAGNDLRTLVRRLSKFQGMDPHKLKSLFDSISFTIPFSFGQFGLFDAYEEVVKPVCALMGVLAPKRATWSLNDGVEYYDVPYPTANTFVGLQIGNIMQNAADGAGETFNKLKSAVKNTFGGNNDNGVGGGGSESSDKLSTANSISENADKGLSTAMAALNGGDMMLESLINSGALNVLKSRSGYANGKYRFANFRYGNVKAGPCFIMSIDGSFDSSVVDENGYPYKGTATITASDMRTTTSDAILQMFQAKQSESS